jgi:3-oxoacyl-[acyl-carrier-protein] synthase-3
MSMPVPTHPEGAAGARILGTGSYQPARVMTNEELGGRLGVDDEWIRARVGVAERRFAARGESVVDMAATAGSKAIADAGLTPAEVDTVVVATCTMPGPIPHAAAQTAERVGVPSPGAFDINAACAGFCYALGTAADRVRVGSAARVLVIGAEKVTDYLDLTDTGSAIIFADGAGAAVVGPAEHPGIGPMMQGSAGEHADLIGLRDGRYLSQEGPAVYRWARTNALPAALGVLDKAGLPAGDVDVLVPHQANLRIIEGIAAGLRAAGARHDMVLATDITHSGNTAAASIPLALDHLRQSGRVTTGAVALLVGYGAGLTYAGQVVICP